MLLLEHALEGGSVGDMTVHRNLFSSYCAVFLDLGCVEMIYEGVVRYVGRGYLGGPMLGHPRSLV